VHGRVSAGVRASLDRGPSIFQSGRVLVGIDESGAEVARWWEPDPRGLELLSSSSPTSPTTGGEALAAAGIAVDAEVIGGLPFVIELGDELTEALQAHHRRS
jgi:hypothetical protein